MMDSPITPPLSTSPSTSVSASISSQSPLVAPLTWADLVALDGTLPDREFARHPEVEAQYAAHRAELSRTGTNLTEYIMTQVLDGDDFTYEENRFPYWTEPGIKHGVFWMKPGADIDPDSIKKMAFVVDGDLAVVFQNMPSRQSVRGVPHYHVFTRPFFAKKR